MINPKQVTCHICHRQLPTEGMWSRVLHGGPRLGCARTGIGVTCWNTSLARIGLTPNMPTVPTFLVGQAEALYRTNINDLLPRYIENARSQGRMVSDEELKTIHGVSMGRTLNDLSKRYRRTLRSRGQSL